ncbi:MAG: hypothetical protein RMI91_13105 [Gemmatales bacterium]|nr:hypothetical protein [Gemmatales bacterium]MDW7995582.1 hypothetical protein [Gemmatales bacterium]
MTDPIQLPPVSPYPRGWTNAEQQAAPRRRQLARASISKAETNADTTNESVNPSAADSQRPGHVVDYEA